MRERMSLPHKIREEVGPAREGAVVPVLPRPFCLSRPANERCGGAPMLLVCGRRMSEPGPP